MNGSLTSSQRAGMIPQYSAWLFSLYEEPWHAGRFGTWLTEKNRAQQYWSLCWVAQTRIVIRVHRPRPRACNGTRHWRPFQTFKTSPFPLIYLYTPCTSMHSYPLYILVHCWSLPLFRTRSGTSGTISSITAWIYTGPGSPLPSAAHDLFIALAVIGELCEAWLCCFPYRNVIAGMGRRYSSDGRCYRFYCWHESAVRR